MSPQNTTVGFGSGLQGWAFTLKDFAKMYCKKFGIDEEKMMKRLWGDNFYDTKEKKWVRSENQDCVRGFVQYILTPIYDIFDKCMKSQTNEKAVAMADKLGVKLTAEERELTQKPLLKVSIWLCPFLHYTRPEHHKSAGTKRTKKKKVNYMRNSLLMRN